MSTETTTDLYRDYLDAALRAAEGERIFEIVDGGEVVPAEGLAVALLGFATGKRLVESPAMARDAILSRSALLAAVSRLSGDADEPDAIEQRLSAYGQGQESGAKDILVRLEEWTRDPSSNEGMAAVRGWIAAERAAFDGKDVPS